MYAEIALLSCNFSRDHAVSSHDYFRSSCAIAHSCVSLCQTNGNVTVWSKCELYFNVENGRITGTGAKYLGDLVGTRSFAGVSVWSNESVPFSIRGCFDKAMKRVELIKTHNGQYSTSTHYTLTLDAPKLRMEGTFAHGNLMLKKNRNVGSQHVVKSLLIDRCVWQWEVPAGSGFGAGEV
jgi:hypothetical protein